MAQTHEEEHWASTLRSTLDHNFKHTIKSPITYIQIHMIIHYSYYMGGILRMEINWLWTWNEYDLVSHFT